MNFSKKVLSVVMTAVMLQSVAVTGIITAAAYNTVSEESQEQITQSYKNFNYVVADNKVTITEYNGYDETVTIPSYINGKKVTAIGEGAFYWNDTIKKVIIPGTVTSIGRNAFCDCEKLATVSIPDSVSTIESGAFQSCGSLTSFIFPKNLTTISSSAFAYTALTNVVLPDNIRYIEGCAFMGCKMTELQISHSVSTIGSWAFEGCENLETLTIPENVKVIGEWAFGGCTSLKNIIIPDNVTTIEKCAFCGCSSVVDVLLPNGITKLNQGVFSACSSLKNITVPESLTHVGIVVFECCENIENVYYAGSQAQWNAVYIDEFYDANRSFEQATIHYNVGGGSEITISELERVVTVGDTFTLTTDRSEPISYTWKSGDTYVATVNQSGRVVARECGTTRIYAKYDDKKTVACKLTVNSLPDISLDKTELSMNVNDIDILTPTSYDEAVTYTFKSNNTAVATVNSSGRVVARGEGTAVITVIASNGGRETCEVTVAPQKKIALVLQEMYMWQPSASSGNTYTFKSNNTAVATVNKAGRIVARGEGTAVITAVASNGAKATCTVNVVSERTLTLNKTSLSLTLQKQYTLTPILTPADDSVTYTFKSSDATVASVNKAGRIVARGIGKANITVKSSNGLTAVCRVTVK